MSFLLVPFCWFGQAPFVSSKEFAFPTQVHAVSATVRVVDRLNRTEGSGVIVAADKTGVRVLTASHLVDQADQLEVHFFSLEAYPRPLAMCTKVTLVARAARVKDLALLRVEQSLAPGVHVKVLAEALDMKGEVSVALAVGCTEGKAPSCALAKVLSAKMVQTNLGAEAVRCWQVEGTQSPGRSGGPMLNAKGHLLGICSGNSKGLSYFIHIEEIAAFLTSVESPK